ncbi:hypothetical protein MRB53_025145 [Persea americana]|uniref:Uncharacterized protein n=1 Tax=Persea americana TaxID=3435 RepID=A0ACC2LEM3_PERAE|nr:hypothetical protein MRB53_025145 [Persea americana]|eukprot:TRINITY_DN271_c0_g1_i2.p1 TRINITY_DN271_c0_g1~~TRINITY_DN271_c0_g1_i2.p1  ORF type:complete len:180 (+),score=37.77 TRINITY_DN271_c0_g1_i2:254-793(+)
MESGKAAAAAADSASASKKEITSSASTVVVAGKETMRAGSSVGGSSLGARGIFSSVFPPPATILGRNSLNFDALGSLRKQDSEFLVGRTEHSSSGGLDKSSGSKTQIVPDKDVSSIYSDQAVEPCFLSSSIHYGGREHYVHSSNARDSPRKYEKEAEEDDLNSMNIASRGDWWQGSLYY